MSRNRLALAALALMAIGASGCARKADPAPPVDPGASAAPASPVTPVAPDPFASAAIFECVGGGEIAVLFGGGDGQTATVRSGASTTPELKLDVNAQEPVFTNGEQSLTLRGGDALYAAGPGDPQECRAVSRELPPPAIAGVVRDLKAADAGSEVTLSVGQSFSVSLSGVPTAGYMWAPSATPAFLEKTAESGGPTSTAQFLPGFAGGSHWEVIAFTARAAGTGELVLAQRRPWETEAEPDAATFKVKVVVK